MDLISRLVEKYPDLAPCVPDVQRTYELLSGCFQQGGKLLICGNGGSAADSEHVVGELMKGYRLPRRLPLEFRRKLESLYPGHGSYLGEHLQGALPAISLVSQISLMTAFSNDVAPDMVFAQQVYGYGRTGDVLIGLSTSGSSKNILYALEVGRAVGMVTIGMTGMRNDAMQNVCDAVISIPRSNTADIQEGHQAVYHAICGMLEESLFDA